MEFRLLGPFDVVAGGRSLRLGGLKQRAVLALLSVRVNEVVSSDTIIDTLWGEHAPRSALAGVRTYVSRLRQTLSAEGGQADRLIGRPPGYVLEVDPEHVDLHRFEYLVGRAREQSTARQMAEASATLGQALALWRGEVLADVAAFPGFQPVIARLENLRLRAVEDHMNAELELGRHAEVLSELQEITRQYPLHEPFWGQLIVALYRSGRQAEALAAFQEARSQLIDQMGIEPGLELRELEQEVLTQTAELATGRQKARPRSPEGSESGLIPLPAACSEGLHENPLVGRSDEWSQLSRLAGTTRAGQLGAVLVSGPPGIGKTALVTRFVRSSHADGVSVVLGRADEGASVPFRAFAEAIDHWVANATADDVQLLGPEVATALARLVPAFGRWHNGSAPGRIHHGEVDDPDDYVGLGNDDDRLVLLEAIVRWVAALSVGRPAIVVLEDLHWADSATLLALRHLLRHPPAARVLLLVTYRDTELGSETGRELSEVLASTRGNALVDRMELSCLGPADVADLLRAEVPGDIGSPGEAFAAQLCRWTGGNPLFVRETLRHLAERGALATEACEWGPGHPAETAGLPAGATEVIEQRLRRLPAPTTRILRQAAVLGDRFDVPLLSRIAGMAPVEVVEALEPAVSARLVDHLGLRSDQFGFSHALAREAIYEGLSLSRRLVAHWHAGQAIASVHASHPEPHLGEIARHLTLGVSAGDPRMAVSANVDAGLEAMETLAFEDAFVRFRSATDLLETHAVEDPRLAYTAWTGLASAAGAAGAWVDSQREGILRSASIAREQKWHRRLARSAVGFMTLSQLHGSLADYLVARDLAGEALDALGDAETADRCLLLASRAAYAVVFDRPEEAEDLAATTGAKAESSDDPTVRACAMMARCWTSFGHPRPEELARLAEELLAYVGPPQVRTLLHGTALLALGLSALQQGDWSKFGSARARVANHPLTERAEPVSACVRQWDVALALSAGRFDEVERLASVGAETVVGRSIWDAVAAAQVGIAAVEREKDGALTSELLESVSYPPGNIKYGAGLALHLAETGDIAAAARQVETLRHADRFRAGAFSWTSAPVFRNLAETAARLGHQDLAADLLPGLCDYSGQLLVSFGGATIECAADRVIGQLLAVLGRHDEAVDRLAAAQSLEHSFGAGALAARTGYWHARTLLDRDGPGDGDTARRLLQQAATDARRFGMIRLEHEVNKLALAVD